MHGIDTNVLVYAFDKDEGEKYRKAKKLLNQIIDGKETVLLASQVCGEFIVATTKKLSKHLSKQEANSIIRNLTLLPNVRTAHYTHTTVLAASESDAPLWDAVLAQTLLENGVKTLYTENEKHFVNSGVKTINPVKI